MVCQFFVIQSKIYFSANKRVSYFFILVLRQRQQGHRRWSPSLWHWHWWQYSYQGARSLSLRHRHQWWSPYQCAGINGNPPIEALASMAIPLPVAPASTTIPLIVAPASTAIPLPVAPALMAIFLSRHQHWWQSPYWGVSIDGNPPLWCPQTLERVMQRVIIRWVILRWANTGITTGCLL